MTNKTTQEIVQGMTESEYRKARRRFLAQDKIASLDEWIASMQKPEPIKEKWLVVNSEGVTQATCVDEEDAKRIALTDQIVIHMLSIDEAKRRAGEAIKRAFDFAANPLSMPYRGIEDCRLKAIEEEFSDE